MTIIKYPNQHVLYKAIYQIYFPAIRSFMAQVLKTLPSQACEPSIGNEDNIDTNDVPHLIRTYWENAFEQHFDRNKDVRSRIGLIGEARNQVAHPGVLDIDYDYARARLLLIAEVLELINASEEGRAVLTLRDELVRNVGEPSPPLDAQARLPVPFGPTSLPHAAKDDQELVQQQNADGQVGLSADATLIWNEISDVMDAEADAVLAEFGDDDILWNIVENAERFRRMVRRGIEMAHTSGVGAFDLGITRLRAKNAPQDLIDALTLTSQLMATPLSADNIRNILATYENRTLSATEVRSQLFFKELYDVLSTPVSPEPSQPAAAPVTSAIRAEVVEPEDEREAAAPTVPEPPSQTPSAMEAYAAMDKVNQHPMNQRAIELLWELDRQGVPMRYPFKTLGIAELMLEMQEREPIAENQSPRMQRLLRMSETEPAKAMERFLHQADPGLVAQFQELERPDQAAEVLRQILAHNPLWLD